MEPIKLNFKDCSLAFMDKTFQLKEVRKHSILDNWIVSAPNYTITDYENETINRYQEQLIYRVDDWNEIELTEHFVSPILNLISFNTEKYGMFSWRPLFAEVGNYLLTGEPDLVIAKGRREPDIPYFCLNEFKKESEAKGDPKGQCLAEMLVAQELNKSNKPIYGVVVKGMNWFFMILQGNQYAISSAYKATGQEIYDIIKLLKHLKTIIEEFVKQE